MKPEQWQRAYEIYQAVCDLPSSEQRAYLESLEAEPEIVTEVLALITRGEDSGPPRNTATDQRSQGPLVGTAFGRYTIFGLLGRGATGDVYAAGDPELNRIIALKFLNSERVGMRSAVHRFVSEAKAASALNHPNIVTVHEVLHRDSTLAIAMELVEGKSLRLFCHEPQHAEQVIHWGRQIAAALAAAHAQGIVHRDIKPENIMLRPDGLIKVLDFGLARNLEGANQTSTAGLPVGTLRYMSPEQARGETLRGATDVFSLGVVLYELATGHHPFAADSPFASAHAIAATDPPAPSSFNRAIPADLESLINTMLAKDPLARPGTEAVVETLGALLLETSRSDRVRVSTRWGWMHPSRKARLGWRTYIVLGAVFLAAVIVPLVYFRHGADEVIPEIAPFTTLPNQQVSPSFSPDGRTVAFAWGSVITHRFSICTKPAEGGNETCLTPPEETDYSPAWSPDGRWIGYLSGAFGDNGSLYIRSPATGEVRKLSDIPRGNWPTQRALAWTGDSKAVIAKENTALFIVPLSGHPRQLTTPPEGTSDFDPAVSSDGSELVFTRSTRKSASLYRLRLDRAGIAQRIELPKQLEGQQFLDACWLPKRHELLVDVGSLGEIWRMRMPGTPQLLARDAYSIFGPAASPDGRHVLYVQDQPDANLWTLKLDAPDALPERLDVLSSTRSEFDPQYSPDGKMIAFQSFRSGYPEIWVGRPDGSALIQLTHFNGPETASPYWSPDGKWVTFDSRVEGVATIFVIAAAGGDPKPITPKGLPSVLPSWSHDGKWIYFASARSGRMEVWRMTPAGAAPEQITRHGGYAAIDSTEGRFVYYAKSRNQDDGLWRLSLETGEDVRVLPRVLERAFAITRQAIYYAYLVKGYTRTKIEKLPFGADHVAPIALFPRPIVAGFSVRSDERELILGQLDTHTSELIMMTLRPK